MHNARRYKDRIRVRACGILVEEGSILLARIHSPVTNSLVWLPPGGELEFGESVEECLIREFKEEAGLEVKVQSFQFINELIEPPFHALELYYKVKRTGGEPKLGVDPERGEDQLLRDLKWISVHDLNSVDLAPDQLYSYL